MNHLIEISADQVSDQPSDQLSNQVADPPFAGLNPEQSQAVRHVDGPLLILAGAGSGKTRVLVHRIAYLIDTAGVSPWSILGITFTNKAAREMKSRVEALLPEQSASIWISTFHSACVRVLRRDIERVGFTRNFTILDRDDQLVLIKDCIRELNLSDKQYVPKNVLEHIGRAKDEMQTPEQYAIENGGDFFRGKIHAVYALYQSKLVKNNALDFDDIILTAIRLLKECPDVRDYYQNKFRYVMVDEYQDTNTAQYELISLLCGKWRNLCVVGDDDQSIYGWRGANVGNILNFEKEYRDARVVKLEQNYRSTGLILEAANNVILKNERRKKKALWTDNERGGAIGCIKVENEYEEASAIAGTLKKLRLEEGLSWSDFAVLYRINAQSRALENVLIREGIPYRIIGGFRFFDRKEVKDILAYLRLIRNVSDDVSFKRVINIPRRGVGAATIEKLETLANEWDISIFEAAEIAARDPGNYPQIKSAAARLTQFVSLIRSFEAYAGTASMDELFELVVSKSGLAAMYEADRSEEGRARLENILEFKSELLEFEKRFESDDIYFEDGESQAAGADAAGGVNVLDGDGSGAADASPIDGSGHEDAVTARGAGLSDFLSHVTLISDVDNFEDEEEKVSLMTMHSAKGLEFDTVFVAGAEEGIFPGTRAMTEASQMEEERRLCYVAITRAKKRLYFTNAISRTIFGSTTYNRLSRFVSDIPPGLIDDLGGFAGRRGGRAEMRGVAAGEKSPAASSGFTAPLASAAARAAVPPASASAGARPFIPIAPSARLRRASPPPALRDRNAPAPAGTAATIVTAAADAGGYANGRAYGVGDTVGHKKYGRGTVTNRYRDEGDVIIEIEFESAGMKRFIEAMVSLKTDSGH